MTSSRLVSLVEIVSGWSRDQILARFPQKPPSFRKLKYYIDPLQPQSPRGKPALPLARNLPVYLARSGRSPRTSGAGFIPPKTSRILVFSMLIISLNTLPPNYALRHHLLARICSAYITA
jgi:hypothetical protein